MAGNRLGMCMALYRTHETNTGDVIGPTLHARREPSITVCYNRLSYQNQTRLDLLYIAHVA